ncbi:unnamed protein product [Rotaria socialis]|uniref:Rhodanese domain-containing protein n=1 Tax=Rotaria socialis TaxID=392032 RepID=A0A821VBP8_9BILA|nr:unnamed protein product [Rotaria socialis]CAF3387207.1 unnamed protein product [Rotaria socialis]CAF3425556.1 unnamed protein product [Rotaria socialis]CAF3723566.1 unnamed protein product [Rotaria socialis]CAF3738590.1 unnamed protein product [Rotaria socialis]
MSFEKEEPVPIFVKPEDLHLYNSVKFVDVRSPTDYAEGHLNNAVNMYDIFTYLLPTSTEEGIHKMNNHFQTRFGELGITGQEHIIIYEQSMNKQYGASCRGFFIFKHMKHPHVSTLEGGLDAMIRFEGSTQTITKETPVIIPCQYHGNDDDTFDSWMASRDDILQVLSNRLVGTWLVDVRDAVEWLGLSSSPYGVDFTPRRGRIPRSVWIEWHKFHKLDNEKHVAKSKSNEQIQALMTTYGIQSDDEIIIYCFKGSRAAVALMKLKEAGYSNVKNYFASWNEWSRDFQLPVDDRILVGNKK